MFLLLFEPQEASLALMQLLLTSQPLPLEPPDLLLLRSQLAALNRLLQPPLVLPESLLPSAHVSQSLKLVLPFLSELLPVGLAKDRVASLPPWSLLRGSEPPSSLLLPDRSPASSGLRPRPSSLGSSRKRRSTA